MPLPVSRLIRVLVNLGPVAAARRSFGALACASDSSVVSGLERLREYSSYEGVVADCGVDSPESKAAQLYYNQVPKPKTFFVARWLRTATAGFNKGGILTAAQQAIANWQVISSGGVVIPINGSNQTLTGLDFTGVTNLNGVASVIQASLTGGATCVWDGSRFVVSSGTTGAGVKAVGSIELTDQPSPSDTVTVYGQAFTFVAANPTTNQVLIGADVTATAANLAVKLQTSVVVNVATANYTFDPDTDTVNIEFKTIGVAGNSFTLAKSGANITISGANLTGGAVASSVGYATAGSGTNLSALLKLDADNSTVLVPGYDSETPAECAAALANKSPAWYGLMFAASVQPTDEQNMAVAGVIEALSLKRIFGVTISDTNCLDAEVTDDLGSLLKDAAYKQSFTQYTSSGLNAVASMFGRAFSVNFAQNRSTLTLMYKQEPGVPGEELTESQASVLEDKRINVYADYVNDTTILQYGTMAGPAWFDEIHGLDWLQNAVETNCYNALYTSKTKVPQTDAGSNVLVNAVNSACAEGVNNGLIAPGVWNADGFGQLANGDYLKDGYYTYAQPIDLQSQSDREARQAPPIQTAIKLAGAIQTVDVLIDVNR